MSLGIELAGGQGTAHALTAIKEILKDLQQYRNRPLIEFCEFLHKKAVALKKADELQMAERKLAEHAQPAAAK